MSHNEEKYMNPESFDISVEEFDAMEGRHLFSDDYKKKRKKMMKEYRQKKMLGRLSYVKVAVIVSLLIVITPIVANATTDGELFNRIWGSFGKKNIESHDEIVYEEGKEPITITYPKREYEDVDPDTADKLIGENINFEPIKKQVGDTKLTILSSVIDGNAAVVEYTLEKKGGVDALNYSQLDNEDTNGASFSDESTFDLIFRDGGGKTYVDLDKSTKDKLYCYQYITIDIDREVTSALSLEITEYSRTRGEWLKECLVSETKAAKRLKISKLSIPIKSKVSKIEYANSEGGSLEVSPLSIKIDMENGLGLNEIDACEPSNVYYLVISYKDGSRYVVWEHEKKGEYTCSTEIDNSHYACMGGHKLRILFNRLVDTDNIKSIIVNESKYIRNKDK